MMILAPFVLLAALGSAPDAPHVVAQTTARHVAAAPTPEPVPTLSPRQVLGKIRNVFRAHRPPPPYVQYTIERKQLTEEGYPDVTGSYTFHVWVRSSDRAGMARHVFRDNYEYPPEFQRPAFNEDRDPGPPTADIFEPAPLHPRPISEAATPEPKSTPSDLAIIGRITSVGEYDYRVVSQENTADEIHLTLEPVRDADRNRLRDLFVDSKTYEIKKFIATDKLFVIGGPKPLVYSVRFTGTMGMLNGIPIVTQLHGKVGDGYVGDGVEVDYYFRDTKFPATLPDWYFDARQYGGHSTDVPM